jgi:cytochrome P450
MSRARRRDRWVYLASHPVLFLVLGLTRRAATRRLGRTVVVHGEDEYRQALTRVPLDRRAPGTTGGMARQVGAEDLLFDQDGGDHRQSRQGIADSLGSAGIERLRPVWTAYLDEAVAVLAGGGRIDVVELAAAMSGATAAVLLDLDVDPPGLARAARAAAAEAARQHAPGWRPRAATADAAQALLRLTGSGLGAMLAVAAVNTTIAAIPRAVSWCADDALWTDVSPELADELLRVIAPTPLLPRVAAAGATVGSRKVRTADRLILVARHAVGAHRRDPDPARPAPPQVAGLIFGAGAHTCPGARMARTQMLDTLAALAPLRPTVVLARADRRSALPSWRRLVIAATT